MSGGVNGSSLPVQNSTTRVTAQLRSAIMDGQLQPGLKLRAEALAERFGTSRSPVREALLTLRREGLVEVLPNRGAVVRRFDRDDLIELYELRCVVEPHVAARAALRIDRTALEELEAICRRGDELADERDPPAADVLELDNRFHLAILEAAGSRRLAEAMEGAFGIPHSLRWRFWSQPERRHHALSQHRQILDALDGRNERLAEAAMRVHLLDAYDALERAFPEV